MLDVLLDDGPLLAINKPAGLPTQSAENLFPSAENLVRQWIKETRAKEGNVYLGLPHRLDRPVSGVLVFTRNSKAAARMAEQFRERTVRKTYLALVEGALSQPEGELVNTLAKVPGEARGIVTTADDPDGKEARLSYRVLSQAQGCSLVEVDLQTGRMHQIRLQLSHLGHPVCGDTLYGAKPVSEALPGTDWPETAIGLHAWRLVVKHPIRYDEVVIVAPRPGYWPSEFGLR